MEHRDHDRHISGQNMQKEKQRSKTAVALSYDPQLEVPKVIASGKGYLADKIIEKAKETDIPVHKDAPLAETLSKLELGDAIPKELYEVVADVLLFVDKLDKIKEKIQK